MSERLEAIDMTIESVLLKKHLKHGEKEFPVGEYHRPIPPEILGEIHRGDLVKVLKRSKPNPPPVPPKQLQNNSVWAVKEKEEVEVVVEKPKPKKTTSRRSAPKKKTPEKTVRKPRKIGPDK